MNISVTPDRPLRQYAACFRAASGTRLLRIHGVSLAIALFTSAAVHAQNNGSNKGSPGTARAQTQNAADTAGAPLGEHVADEILVGFHPGAAAPGRVGARASVGATKRKEFGKIHVEHWKLPPGLNVVRAIEILTANPNVRFAEPNYVVRANDIQIPSDELRGDLWGMHNVGQSGGSFDPYNDADIDALEAWQLPAGSGEVVVAVIDSGIDYNHPDLRDKIYRDANGKVVGYDFVNNDNDPMDDNRHGTHVAGTIAGVGNNGIGVIGVAGLNTNVKLVPIKFLSATGSGSTDNAISSVLYAAELKDGNGNQLVRITNNSWGGGASSEALKSAIAAADSLFVAAAGNAATSNLHYPAGYVLENVLAVAASDSMDRLASFSNYGAWVHFAAPGVGIVSTTPGDTYTRLNGTSMATPHVAGAAALVLSQTPGMSPVAVKQRLLSTGDARAALQGKTASGTRLNVARALGLNPDPESAPDPNTPSPALDLAVANARQSSVELQWTGAADADAAYLYDVRYRSGHPLTESNWASATPFLGEPIPSRGGVCKVVIGELAPGTVYHFGVKTVNRSGLPSALVAGASAQTSNLGWRPALVETVGSTSSSYSYVSMALNGSSQPVMAYSDYPGSRMKLASWNGSSWSIEVASTSFGAPSIGLDNGKAVFAWGNGTGLCFSSKASGKWVNTLIERGSVSQMDAPSLAFDRNGVPAISYRFSVNGSNPLKLATRTGASWTTQVVHPNISLPDTALAFQPSTNSPAVVYFTRDASSTTAYTVRIAEKLGANWVSSAVEENLVGYIGDCSLAFDPAGNPVVSHWTNGKVRMHRRNSSGVWSHQTIDSGNTCGLTVVGNRAYLAYRSGNRIKVAKAILPPDATVDAEWDIQVAETEGGGTDRAAIQLQVNSSTGAAVAHLGYFLGTDLFLTREDSSYRGASYVFQDNMEEALETWTAEGNRRDSTSKTLPPSLDPDNNNLWQRTERRSTTPGHSPTFSWYYGDPEKGTYDTGMRNWGRLKTGPIVVPSGSRAELKLSQLVLAEGGRLENGEVQVRVALSVDESGAPSAWSSWTTVFQRASRSATSFVTDIVSLNAYLGKTIEVGFFFDTTDAKFNGYEGWYVDDVSVKVWP